MNGKTALKNINAVHLLFICQMREAIVGGAVVPMDSQSFYFFIAQLKQGSLFFEEAATCNLGGFLRGL